MEFFIKNYETAFEALRQYGEYAHMSDINGIRAIELGAVLYMVADFAARRTDIDRADFRADVVEWLDKKTNHGEQDIRELFFPRVRFYRSVPENGTQRRKDADNAQQPARQIPWV